jgi:hypothetical protein
VHGGIFRASTSVLIIAPPTKRRFLLPQPMGLASQSQGKSDGKADSRLALSFDFPTIVDCNGEEIGKILLNNGGCLPETVKTDFTVGI